MVAQDLEFDGEVDLADGYADRHRKDGRGKVENARDAGFYEPIAGSLSGRRRCRDNPDRDSF